MKSAALVAGAVLIGCAASGSAEQVPSIPPSVQELSHDTTEQIEHDFTAIVTWAGLSTKLVVLDGADKYPTALGQLTKEDGPMYMSDINAVVVGSTPYSQLLNQYTDREPLSKRAMSEFVIAHELGHRQQIETAQKQSDQGFTKDLELGADCFAGRAVRQLFSQDVTSVPRQIRNFPQSPAGTASHGSNEDRINSFMRGASSGQC